MNNSLGVKIITIKRKTSCNIESKNVGYAFTTSVKLGPKSEGEGSMLKHLPFMKQKVFPKRSWELEFNLKII